MDAGTGLLVASGTVTAIDQFLKHRQRLLDNGQIPLDQKITQHVRNFVKSLSRENSRESTPIPSIQMEEIYEERDSEEITNDIPLETRPALTRQSHVKKPKVKSSLLSTIFKNVERKHETPVQVLDDIFEIEGDQEFHKFVSKIIKFISHEIEVNKEGKVYQTHKSLHKKLIYSLNAQHKETK